MSASRGTKWASLSVFLLGCAGVGASGCSAAQGTDDVASSSAASSECLGTSATQLRVCPNTKPLTGVDVSYYQGRVDWKKVKAAGRSFAFVRVSDGIDHPDTEFARNWPGMKTAGVKRGFYQFFRPAKDVTKQVNLLVSKVNAAGGLQPGDLPPVLDLESTGGLSSATVIARAKSWLTKVEATYHVKPIVYTAAFMSETIGEAFAGYTLWVANYGATCPSMPSGWTDWQFWQDSDSGSVGGVTGHVDTNLFNGTFADLDALGVTEDALASGFAGEVDVDEDADLATDDAISFDGVDGAADDEGGEQGAAMGSSQQRRREEAAPSATSRCAAP